MNYTCISMTESMSTLLANIWSMPIAHIICEKKKLYQREQKFFNV